MARTRIESDSIGEMAIPDNADYKVMLAVTLLIGVIYALVNILVDVVHGLIDPRLREQG